jgi:SAM-dependent methyltransferase
MARTSPKPVRTLYRGTNADLLVDVARLYIPDGALVADVTWGKGVFWRKTDASRFTLVGSEIEEARIREAAGVTDPQWTLFTDQRRRFLVADCRRLPYRDQRLDVLVLDPPYMHHPNLHETLVMAQYNNVTTTQGMSHQAILRELYCPALLEAARVLKPGGLLFVKGKDEIEHGRQCWSRDELPRAATRCGFTEQDFFLYESQAGMANLPWNGEPAQRHARKNHSYLFVFVLTAPPRRITRGRPRKDSATSPLKGQRDSRYLRDRLMQGHAPIYARYMAGELASVHAAAKVAGLVGAKISAAPQP